MFWSDNLSFTLHDFLAASAANNYEKQAVIKSAASAASAQGSCVSSRLDHGLKFYLIRSNLLEALLYGPQITSQRRV